MYTYANDNSIFSQVMVSQHPRNLLIFPSRSGQWDVTMPAPPLTWSLPGRWTGRRLPSRGCGSVNRWMTRLAVSAPSSPVWTATRLWCWTRNTCLNSSLFSAVSSGKNSESYCKHAICAITNHFVLWGKNSEWNYLLWSSFVLCGWQRLCFIKIPLLKILWAVSFTTKIILFEMYIIFKCTWIEKCSYS